jgi:hypothetical protein
VGPMTIAALLANTVMLAEEQRAASSEQRAADGQRATGNG